MSSETFQDCGPFERRGLQHFAATITSKHNAQLLYKEHVVKHTVLKCGFIFSPGFLKSLGKGIHVHFERGFQKVRKEHWAFNSPGSTVSC